MDGITRLDQCWVRQSKVDFVFIYTHYITKSNTL